MKDISNTFVEKLFECSLHKKRLLSAKGRLSEIMPLNIKDYSKLDDINLGLIDQMIYRFSKLQDTMGEGVFSGILILNKENVKEMAFIDRVNRLEELSLVNKEEWFHLRKYRNEVTHEYSFNKKEVVEGINLIYKETDTLLKIYDSIFQYCLNRFKFVSEFFSNLN